MTHDARTASEIERDIENDRSRLNDNLESLQDRFSVDGALGQIGDQLREHGGDIGQSITRTVKENPAAVALTGIGIAWMIFGGKSRRDDMADRHARRPHRADTYRADHRGVVSRPDPRMKGGTAGLPDWAHEDDSDTLSDRLSRSAASAREGLGNAASTTSEYARNAKDGVASSMSSARDTASHRADELASNASEASHSVKERAERLRRRLSEGTENLSEEARSRVVAAREAALDARRRAADAVSARSEQASDIYERQPLVVGALALAVGAAIAGALPRTRTEDDWVGDYSDELMRRAETVFEQEREKAAAVVSAAKDEAQTIGKEAREDLNSGAPGDKSAAQAVADKAKASGKRVADAAAKEADKKDLGKISS
jgi:hypothetical protein